MTVLEIEAIAEAIEANAPLRFAQTCHDLGIHPNVVRGLMDAHPANARWLIQRLAGTKADKQAILDAYELYLAESGQVVFKLARM